MVRRLSVPVAAIASVTIALCIGRFVESPRVADRETLIADRVVEHIVEPYETVWEVAAPIAEARGQDVREVIHEIQVNNDLDVSMALVPGQ